MVQNNICKFCLGEKIFLSFIFNYSNNSYAFVYVFVHPIRKYILSVQYVISSYCNLYPLCANICLILLLRIYLQVSCCEKKRITLFVCGKIKIILYIYYHMITIDFTRPLFYLINYDPFLSSID